MLVGCSSLCILLLIEPIWNRNVVVLALTGKVSTFNRTNME